MPTSTALHGLVVLGPAADEDPAVGEHGALGRGQQALGQHRRLVAGVDRGSEPSRPRWTGPAGRGVERRTR